MTVIKTPTTPGFPDVTVLDTTERLLGGEAGPLNRAATQLVERTAYLKKQVEASQASVASHEKATDPHPQYMTEAEVTTAIKNKADKATTLTGYGIGDGVRYGLVAGQSMNTYTAPGLYEYDPQADGAPTTEDNHRVLSMGGQQRWSQLAFTWLTDRMYFRRKQNDTFSAWREIWHTGNLANPATKEDVASAIKTAIDGLVAGSPGALDTLKELATALGDDANYAATVTNALAAKADISTTLAGYGITDALSKNHQGSIGLGVTPKTWGGGQYPVVQINAKTSITADANSTYYSTNSYVNSSTSNYAYLGSGYALQYSQSAYDGYHRWKTAVSGATDGAITFATVMQIDPSGVLTVPSGIASLPSVRGASSGLTINYPGTSGVVTVAANELVLENSNNVYQTLRAVNVSATSGSTTAAAGGLDTGSWAFGTLYHLFVVYNPTTSATALLWSLSTTAPTLPAGYTFYARIGANKTQGATNYWFLGGTQRGRVFQHLISATGNVTGAPLIASGSAGSTTTPTYVAISLSSFIPATASAVRLLAMQTGSGATIMVAPNAGYGAYASSSNPPPVYLVQPSAGGASIQPMTLLLESTSIYWVSSASTNFLYVYGWEDNL